jgi:peptide/nickel transport system ATP-binding protein
LALVGESGSGKSTLGRCIAGLHRPESGEVRLVGTELAPTAQARPKEELRAIQIVFQNPERSLNPVETVADAIRRPLMLFGTSPGMDASDEIGQLLDKVRLPRNVANKYPGDLSGGEKQRVAIARALAAKPFVLICDEITSSLDVSIQAAVVQLLSDLRLGGLSILFITHNLPLVRTIADRVAVLEKGRICEEGEASRVIAFPHHEYTKELLAAAPEI